MSGKSGVLYLIPVTLGEYDPALVIPEPVLDIARSVDCFIAENAKSARWFIKSIHHSRPLQEIKVMEMDKHADKIDFDYYFDDIRKGMNTALISEAGIPSVADPGSPFVLQAHREKIKVVPLSGPSSILLALAASGMNGQQFVFHGYLPKDKFSRIEKIRAMETNAKKLKQTQIFMETPYRNQQMLDDLLFSCQNSTLLCLASNITASGESIVTKSIAEWKKEKVDPGRKPTVFLLM